MARGRGAVLRLRDARRYPDPAARAGLGVDASILAAEPTSRCWWPM